MLEPKNHPRTGSEPLKPYPAGSDPRCQLWTDFPDSRKKNENFAKINSFGQIRLCIQFIFSEIMILFFQIDSVGMEWIQLDDTESLQEAIERF